MDNLNLFEELSSLLKKKDRYCSEDGILLKNAIVEDALQLSPELIRILLTNERIKKNFFSEIDGIIVFDKVRFQKFVMNKRFLPDSYTSFKNKIGLVGDNEDFLAESREVVLSWPYKDCVLEGGQTKEDAKRNEIFWNEILAADQITRLTEPKVLTNFKKYSIEGEEEVNDITKNDNLIIKGNNLLALYSLLKTYKGQIKLIYIDPPYNTGNDSFQYNDSFNHSTWLTFMKNRLEVARELLRDDGVIFVQCDHHELGYLNILLDEVFDTNNKIQQIAVKVASASGFKAVNPGPIDVLENILMYAKNKRSIEFKRNYVVSSYHENYNKYLDNSNSNIEKWELISLKEKVITHNGYNDERELKNKFGEGYRFILQQMVEDFAFEYSENVVSIRDLHKPTQRVRELQELSMIERNKFFVYEKQDGDKTYIINGGAVAFYSTKKQTIDGEIKITELLTNFWDHISWAGIANEGNVKLKNGKKPEKLLKQILELNSNKGDIVLDFFSGSGTTAAVAHKMGRRYIGIEQLDYGENDSVVRLKNVIGQKVKDGMFDKVVFDQGGISKAVDWKGGGSFVYCELAKANQIFFDEIEKAESKQELNTIWDNIQKNGFLSWKVNLKTINKEVNNFSELSFEDTKRFLSEVLDKNLLYIPLSEIDSKEFNVSTQDKTLTNKFYEKIIQNELTK